MNLNSIDHTNECVNPSEWIWCFRKSILVFWIFCFNNFKECHDVFYLIMGFEIIWKNLLTENPQVK